MKKIYFCLIILFSINFTSAQSKGIVVYDAYSGRSIQANPPNDNGYPNEYTIEKGKLYFDESQSLYQQKQNETKVVHRIQNGVPSSTTVERSNRDKTGWVYFINKKDKIVLSRDSFYNKTSFVSIKEPAPNVSWKITTEKKNIGGYESIKATTDFAGRMWEAWYIPEIPISLGPWKLGGLPGLIIEARDSKLDFIYKLKELKLPADFDESIISDKYFHDNFIARDKFVAQDNQKKRKRITYLETLARENDGSISVKFDPTLEVHED